MRVRISLIAILAVMNIVAFSPATVHAESAKASLTVTATVRPWIRFSYAQNIVTYRVAKEDLERGYIDLANAVTISLKSNVRDRIAIAAEEAQGKQLQLRENFGSSFSGTYGVDMSAYRSGSEIQKNLDVRITLPSGTQPGSYQAAFLLTTAS